MKPGFSVAIVGLGLLAARVPLSAHHSTAATFDITKVVTLQGVVTEVTWLNPHGTFSLNVKDADGNTVRWTVELPPPNALTRRGWKRDDLKPGDQVSVDLWRAKDESRLGNALTVIFPDGRTVDFPRSPVPDWQTVTSTLPPAPK
jgi:hypothetical protein